MAELVTNGTFDTDITGWTAIGVDIDESWQAGRLRVGLVQDGTTGYVAQQLTGLTIGNTYSISGDGFIGTMGTWEIRVRNGSDTANLYESGSRTSDGSVMSTWDADETSAYVFLTFTFPGTEFLYSEFDNISVDSDASTAGYCGTHLLTRNQRYRRILLPQA